MLPSQGEAVRLRRVGAEAASLLATLCRGAFGESNDAWSEADFSEILNLPTSIALVAELPGPSDFGPDDYPAGFILFTALALESEILTLGVAPALRKQGVGSRLVQAALDFSAVSPDPAPQGRSLFLEVRQDNIAAQALYEGLGFVPVGRRKAYYVSHSGERQDAIVMRIDII